MSVRGTASGPKRDKRGIEIAVCRCSDQGRRGGVIHNVEGLESLVKTGSPKIISEDQILFIMEAWRSYLLPPLPFPLCFPCRPREPTAAREQRTDTRRASLLLARVEVFRWTLLLLYHHQHAAASWQDHGTSSGKIEKRLPPALRTATKPYGTRFASHGR